MRVTPQEFDAVILIVSRMNQKQLDRLGMLVEAERVRKVNGHLAKVAVAAIKGKPA